MQAEATHTYGAHRLASAGTLTRPTASECWWTLRRGAGCGSSQLADALSSQYGWEIDAVALLLGEFPVAWAETQLMAQLLNSLHLPIPDLALLLRNLVAMHTRPPAEMATLATVLRAEYLWQVSSVGALIRAALAEDDSGEDGAVANLGWCAELGTALEGTYSTEDLNDLMGLLVLDNSDEV